MSFLGRSVVRVTPFMCVDIEIVKPSLAVVTFEQRIECADYYGKRDSIHTWRTERRACSNQFTLEVPLGPESDIGQCPRMAELVNRTMEADFVCRFDDEHRCLVLELKEEENEHKSQTQSLVG